MTDYSQLLDLMRSRRSVRRFEERAVSRDDVNRLLEAARWAPSNHNRQPWRFLVFEDRGRIAALAEEVERDLTGKIGRLPATLAGHFGEFVHYATLFGGAPVVIAALHRRPVSLSAALLDGVPNPLLVSGEPLSVAMAIQNLLLAAHALGLGACVLTGPLLAPGPMAAGLAVPDGYDLTCLVAVGHPAESPVPPRRKAIEQSVVFEAVPPPGEYPPHQPGEVMEGSK